MQNIHLEKFKKILAEEETRLIAELETVGRRNPENPDDWEGTPGSVDPDPADLNERAEKVEEFEGRSAVEEALETELILTRRAKQKIEDDEKNGTHTFGICEISGEEIEEDRLDAYPAALTCKKHKEEK